LTARRGRPAIRRFVSADHRPMAGSRRAASSQMSGTTSKAASDADRAAMIPPAPSTAASPGRALKLYTMTGLLSIVIYLYNLNPPRVVLRKPVAGDRQRPGGRFSDTDSGWGPCYPRRNKIARTPRRSFRK